MGDTGDVVDIYITELSIFGLIISWAIPGQGGRGHVNCKSNADISLLLAEERI
jgi:hypothetical protein